MLNRVQRLLRGWRRQLAPRRRREPPEGEGRTQDVSRFPAESGEIPASAGQVERSELTGVADGGSVAASTAALAREIRGRLRLGVGRRAIHRARRVSLSEPRSLSRYVAPTITRHVRMTPLPLVGGVPSGAGPDVVVGADIGPQEDGAFGQSTGDAAWDALWALRGARSMPDVGPEHAQEPAVASGQRPAQRATDQETAPSPEGSADGRAESAAVSRGAPAVPARRQPASRRIQTRAAPPGATQPGPDFRVAGRPLARRVTELGTVRHPQRTEVSPPMAPSVEPAMAAPEPQREVLPVTEPPVGSTLESWAAGGPVKAPPSPSGQIEEPAAAPVVLRGAGLPETLATGTGVASSGEAQEAIEPIGPESTAESLRARPAESARRQPRRDVHRRGPGSKVQRASHGMPETGPVGTPEGERDIGTQEEPGGEMQPGTPGHVPEGASGPSARGAQKAPETPAAQQAAPPPQSGFRSQPGSAPARPTAGPEKAAVPRSVPEPDGAPTQAQLESAPRAPEPLLDRPPVRIGPVPAVVQHQPAAESTAPLAPGTLQKPTPESPGPQIARREMDGGVRPHSEASSVEALPQVSTGTEPGSHAAATERPSPSRLLVGLRRFLPLRRLARQRMPVSRAIEKAQEPPDGTLQQAIGSGQPSTVDGLRSAVGSQPLASREPTVAEGTEQMPTQASYGEAPAMVAPDLARRTVDSHRLEPLLGRAPSAPLPLAGMPARRAAARQVSSRSARPDVASSLGGESDRQMLESGGLQGWASGAERSPEHVELPGQIRPVEGHPAATAPVVQRAIRGPRDLQQLRQPMLKSTLQPMTVQRVASQPSGAGAAPAASAAGPAASDVGPGPTGQGEGQDLETMAQEVYRIIRRRLAIERERARGGL